jgi:hypothetical protein
VRQTARRSYLRRCPLFLVWGLAAAAAISFFNGEGAANLKSRFFDAYRVTVACETATARIIARPVHKKKRIFVLVRRLKLSKRGGLTAPPKHRFSHLLEFTRITECAVND